MVFLEGRSCYEEKRNHSKDHQTLGSFSVITQGKIQAFISLIQEDLHLIRIISSRYSLVLLPVAPPPSHRSILRTNSTATDIPLPDSIEETCWCGLVILLCLDLSALEQTA